MVTNFIHLPASVCRPNSSNHAPWTCAKHRVQLHVSVCPIRFIRPSEAWLGESGVNCDQFTGITGICPVGGKRIFARGSSHLRPLASQGRVFLRKVRLRPEKVRESGASTCAWQRRSSSAWRSWWTGLCTRPHRISSRASSSSRPHTVSPTCQECQLAAHPDFPARNPTPCKSPDWTSPCWTVSVSTDLASPHRDFLEVRYRLWSLENWFRPAQRSQALADQSGQFAILFLQVGCSSCLSLLRPWRLSSAAPIRNSPDRVGTPVSIHDR